MAVRRISFAGSGGYLTSVRLAPAGYAITLGGMVPELCRIQDAQPLGQIDGLDMYLREKGAKHIADTIAFTISADEVAAAAASAREELLADQPADRKAAFLVRQLKETLGSKRYHATEPLARTALTDLFAERYNVDIATHTGGSERLYVNGGVASSSAGNTVYMNYGISEGELHGLFWQYSIDQEYGFANMHCVGPLGNVMLRGSANVIGVGGVAEALQSDIALLGNSI